MYPLKHLATYIVKQNFTSDKGYDNADLFAKGQQIQYVKNTSNIHDMMEIIHFKDVTTEKELIWKTRVENLYDHWQDYLMISQQK